MSFSAVNLPPKTLKNLQGEEIDGVNLKLLKNLKKQLTKVKKSRKTLK
jgi:hypothetical protein